MLSLAFSEVNVQLICVWLAFLCFSYAAVFVFLPFFRRSTSRQCHSSRVCNHPIATLSRRLRGRRKHPCEDHYRPNGHGLHWSGFLSHLPQHDSH